MSAVGLGVWLYYQHHALTADAAAFLAEQPSRAFPYFIVHELPVGVSGLLIAGIFAAGISTLDSALAALSETTVNGIYRKWIRPDADEAAMPAALAGLGGRLGDPAQCPRLPRRPPGPERGPAQPRLQGAGADLRPDAHDRAVRPDPARIVPGHPGRRARRGRGGPDCCSSSKAGGSSPSISSGSIRSPAWCLLRGCRSCVSRAQRRSRQCIPHASAFGANSDRSRANDARITAPGRTELSTNEDTQTRSV